jgi:hypothetical protein
MAGPDGIPDARQKICYWVGQTHSFSFIPRSSAEAETSGNAYYRDQCSVFSVQQETFNLASAVSSVTNKLTTHHCSLTTVFLPARLHDAGDLALERQATETQTAYAELAQVTARPSAELAPVVLARAELRLPRVLYSFCSGCHKSS